MLTNYKNKSIEPDVVQIGIMELFNLEKIISKDKKKNKRDAVTGLEVNDPLFNNLNKIFNTSEIKNESINNR